MNPGSAGAGAAESGAVQGEASTPDATLLIVDDEALARDDLARALSAEGFAVECACDRRAALRVVHRVRCDLALVDLAPPGFDALQTVAAIRSVQPGVECVLLAGDGELEAVAGRLREGSFELLRKPVEKDLLNLAVARALGRRALEARLEIFDRSREFLAALEPAHLHPRIVAAARQAVRADDASLMLLDAQGFLVLAHSTSLEPAVAAGVREPLGAGIAGRVAHEPGPLLIHEDVAYDDRFRGGRSARPVRSAIICPLMLRGELLGVLNLSRGIGRERFTETDRRHAGLLVSLVGPAIANARLYAGAQAGALRLEERLEESIQGERMDAMGDLLEGVAHEINNPLCSVLGYVRSLLQGDLDPKVRRAIEGIARESERASRALAGLQALRHRDAPDLRPLRINDLIRGTIERRASELRGGHIEVATDLAADLPAVRGDLGQLQTALAALIARAQQAIAAGRGRGTIRIGSGRRDGRVLVTVADDGAGLPAADLRRIFDPFFGARAIGQESGLGLSIAFAIVRDHQGVLRAGSAPEQGSWFTIDLPEAGGAGEGAAAAPGTAPAASRTAMPHILAAERESGIQESSSRPASS